MKKGIIEGKCLICGYKGGLMAVREFRGNTFETVLLCEDCYNRRCSHGGTCESCAHFDQQMSGRCICTINGRMVMRGDRCGRYEERKQ